MNAGDVRYVGGNAKLTSCKLTKSTVDTYGADSTLTEKFKCSVKDATGRAVVVYAETYLDSVGGRFAGPQTVTMTRSGVQTKVYHYNINGSNISPR